MKNFDDLIHTRHSLCRAKVARAVTRGETQNDTRRGLAPLEMIMVLPALMMVMSMIIVFGYAASWKLRTETVARDAAWRARWHRFANRDARPDEWPSPAEMRVRRGSQLQAFGNEAVLEDPVIAGPIPNVTVNDNRLDFSRGVIEGIAALDREPPIFAKLGPFVFQVEHPILDDRFQFRQMGIGNRSRRIPLIYEIGLDFIRDSDGMQQAVFEIDNAPFRDSLRALDEDQEFIDWYGTAPDFHPRPRWFCNTDRLWVEINRVGPLNRRISRVPRSMAMASIRLYQEQLEAETSPAVRQQLQQKIDALMQWLSTMDN